KSCTDTRVDLRRLEGNGDERRHGVVPRRDRGERRGADDFERTGPELRRSSRASAGISYVYGSASGSRRGITPGRRGSDRGNLAGIQIHRAAPCFLPPLLRARHERVPGLLLEPAGADALTALGRAVVVG